MAQQDYTTATEVDPGSDLTITSDTIAIDTLDRDELTWVYWDEGAGGISGNLTYTLQVKQITATLDFLVALWSLGNELAGFAGRPVSVDQLTIYFTNVLGADRPQLSILSRVGSVTNSDTSIELSNNTDYWLNIVVDIDALTITCFIYSNALMTTLVDTMVANIDSAISMRYLFALRNYGTGTSGHSFSGYVKNLDILGVANIIIFRRRLEGY